MMDIGKHIRRGTLPAQDPEGYLLELDAWNEGMARQRAQADGIELKRAHWAVLYFLRDHYAACGPGMNGRAWLEAMTHHFRGAGGARLLFRLFPHGPVTQGCRIAGLPQPPHCSDAGFGSTH